MITITDKKINNLLVKRGILTKEKAQEVIDSATKENKPLLEILLGKFVDESTLLSVIAREVNIPPILLDKFTPDAKVLENFNEEWANTYNVLPLAKLGDNLTLAVADPFDVLKLDDIRLLSKCDLRLVVTLEKQLKEAIQRVYHPEKEEETNMEELVSEAVGPEMELTESKEDEDIDLSQLAQEAGEQPVIKLVNRLLYQALQEEATDIHIEPLEKKVRVRFRRDGILQEIFFPPKRVHNALISRIKIMGGLDIAERRIPQDGKFQIKYEGRRIDIRTGIIPTIHGERAMLRLLDSSTLTLTIEDLGFEPEAYDAFKRAIDASYGMVLVTGPTGSGKTTTLYCAVKEVFTPEDNLITVEDPVEYQLPGIIQVQVDTKQGRTFAAALRSILRQDPDIIMIGEMRDFETADIAVKAAITGHLVFSTLHTNDAASTVTRLVDMGVDPFMVAASVLLVANQRLIRRLCPHCKQPAQVSKERLLEIGFKPEECETATIYQPVGCTKCFGGYRSRFALYEVLELKDEIKRLIIQGASALDLKDYAVKKTGMVTLRRAGIAKVLKGETSINEILKTT